MKKSFLFAVMLLVIALVAVPAVYADNTYHNLAGGTFVQDWSDTGLITADDDWSGVPSIIGYRGDDLPTGDPQLVLGDNTVADVNANKTTPSVAYFVTGGVTEFEIADPTISIKGSGTADAPFILIHLNTTGISDIRISYNLRDIDGSARDTISPFALQYRIGTSGNFTNVPAGFVADATEANTATKVTPISVVLPSAVNNQSQVQIRIITTNVFDTDEFVGIDDIRIEDAIVVTSKTPSANAMNIAENSDIVVQFDENVDGTTVTADTFNIDGSISGRHTSAFSISADTVTANPDNDFAAGETVTVTLTTGIKSTSGASLAKPVTWQFKVRTNASIGKFVAHPTTPSFGADNSRSVALGDLDGDGDSDAIIVNDADETVWLNNGSGIFSLHQSFNAGNNNIAVALGDIDNDGDLDAVMANAGGEAETVWLNNGSGTFTAHSTPSFGADDSYNLTLGDIDGDGDLDAVVANYNNQAQTVWLNDGSGIFTPHPTTPSFGTGNSVYVALGDIDGDGDSDAVVANALTEAETVWLNDGSGNFTLHPTTPSFGADNSHFVVLGDLDNDGDLDAVVANRSNQADTVWLNDGTGNFSFNSSFGASESISVALGDIDGNGDLDVIIANHSGQAETLWLNNGSGIFTSHSATPSFGAGDSLSVAFGDIDGDGDIDAVVANYTNQAETVWINTPPEIAVSSPAIAGADIKQGTSNHVLYRLNLAVTDANATLNGLTLITAGSYDADDLTNLKVRYSADAVLDAGDTTLSNLASVSVAGGKNFTPFTSQVINAGTTGYLFITTDISAAATLGNTVNIKLPALTDIFFVLANKTGVPTAGGVQTIISSNTAPVINSQNPNPLGTNEDTLLAIGVGNLNITDPDSTSFTLTVQNGTNYTVSGTTITPSANFNGTLTIPVFVNDGSANSNTFNLAVAVNGINDAPIITGVQGSLATNEDTPLTLGTGNLNITDPDSTSFTLTVQNGANYTVSGNTITPAVNFSGNLTVPVFVNDGSANSNVFNLAVTVNPVNDAPVITGVQGSLATNEDTPLTLGTGNLNISDPDNSSFTLTIQGGTNYTVSGTTITPSENFNGTLTIPIFVNDGSANSNTFNLAVAVNGINDAPVITGVQGSLATNEDTPLTLGTGNLNITDPDNSSFTLTIQGGMNYTVSGTTITPSANFNGILTISVFVNDGSANSNTFNLAVTVNAINDAPVANNDAYSTNEDTPLSGNLLSNDTDVEGNPLSAFVSGNPAHGSLTLNANGSFSYTPHANYNGTDVFTYYATDGNGNSNVATAAITISSVNDTPVLNDIVKRGNENSVICFSASDFFATFGDADGEPLNRIRITSLPSDGVLSVDNAPVEPDQEIPAAKLDMLRFDPAPEWYGDTLFGWNASDGKIWSDASANVNITIYPDPVSIGAIEKIGLEDTDIQFDGSDLRNFDLGYDSIIKAFSLPDHGELLFDPERTTPNHLFEGKPMFEGQEMPIDELLAGELVFRPDPDFNGTDGYLWRASKAGVWSADDWVKFTITPVNDPPVINGVQGSLATNEDTPMTIGLSNLNITDIDSSSFTLTVLNGINYTVSDTTITPSADFNGTLTVPVKVNDGETDSAVFNLAVSVKPVNDAPFISDIANQSTDDDVPATAGFTINDMETLPENLNLSGESSDPVLIGSIAFSGSGKNRAVTVTPVSGMSGTSEITVTITDEDGGIAESLFAVTITKGTEIVSPSMSVSLSDDRDGDGKVSIGDSVAYTVTLFNSGDRDASGVFYANEIPEHTAYVPDSVSVNLGGFQNIRGLAAYNAETKRIEWNGDIPIGAELKIIYEVSVEIGVLFGQVIGNQGTVSYDSTGDGEKNAEEETDGDPGEPGNQPAIITANGGFVVIKAAETIQNLQGLPAARPGDEVGYTVTLTNQSGYDVTGILFAEILPGYLRLSAESITAPESSNVSSEENIINISGISIPAYGEVILIFRGELDEILPAGAESLSGQSTVTYDSDGDSVNNVTDPAEQLTEMPIAASPDFGTAVINGEMKTGSSNSVVVPGDVLIYTVAIPNTGNQDAAGVIYTCPLPEGVSFVPGSLILNPEGFGNPQGLVTYDADLHRIEWRGDIPVGNTPEITFGVTVNNDVLPGEVIRTEYGIIAYDTDLDGRTDVTEHLETSAEFTVSDIFAREIGYTHTALVSRFSGGVPTSYHYECQSASGHTFSTPEKNAEHMGSDIYADACINGLEEQTTYRCRLVVKADGNIRYGEYAEFTTAYTLPGGDGMAISKESSAIASWATGWENMKFGSEFGGSDRFRKPEAAMGKSDATNGCASAGFLALGEGGSVVLTFDKPITDGPGADFAVFAENSTDDWLEIAFAEVSSDGENFVRFDTESLNPPGFGSVDPAAISGFAGRYRTGYGTPFDLADLTGKEEVRNRTVNLRRITHVRLVDVKRGEDSDSEGNPVYDAYYHAPSQRAGFDLDAVGVIHETCDYGDVNNDGAVNLKDAILVLKIISGVQGFPASICLGADVNSDMQIGIEELAYILRKVSGL